MLNLQKCNEQIFDSLRDLCTNYKLSPHVLNEGEVALVGASYILLVWCDRDGVSLNYVNTSDSSSELKIHDLLGYIIKYRGWKQCVEISDEDDYTTRSAKELHSLSINLPEFSSDILEGAKNWFAKTQSSSLPRITQVKLMQLIKDQLD